MCKHVNSSIGKLDLKGSEAVGCTELSCLLAHKYFLFCFSIRIARIFTLFTFFLSLFLPHEDSHPLILAGEAQNDFYTRTLKKIDISRNEFVNEKDPTKVDQEVEVGRN